MRREFGGIGRRRNRSDQKPALQAPNNWTTCHYAECGVCNETVVGARGGYWDIGDVGWKAHKHQPAGDDVWRADPLNGGK